MSADGTGWPLLDERPRTDAGVRPQAKPRRRPRPAWALAALAFVCGGLVSAAAFSVGWRHQAQRGSQAETALASATAHVHSLQGSLAAARRAEARTEARLAATRKSARASARTLSRAAAELAAQASDSAGAAAPVSSGAGTMTATAGRVARELKTLSDYLTTTPASQLDGGYVAAQIAYLTRQLDTLQKAGGSLGAAAATFEAAAKKLAASAGALSPRN